MAHRYIISFTKSAQHVADVFELAHLSFAHEEDVPELDVIPLFEQLEDLEGCVDVLDQMLTLPVVQKRLCSDQPPHGGHAGLLRLLQGCRSYHGHARAALRAGAHCQVGREKRYRPGAHARPRRCRGPWWRPGQQGRAGAAQGFGQLLFKLTEQGEVIFARYGNRTLAQRHVESVAAATLFAVGPERRERPTPRPRRSSGIWPRSSTPQATSAIWTC